MSSYYDPPPYSPEEPRPAPRPSSWGLAILVVLFGVVAILLGLVLFSALFRESWDTDAAEARRREREAEAAAQAEAFYRKRQAELKAESEAAAERLAARDIPRSMFRDVVITAGPAVVNITNEALARRGAPGGAGTLDLDYAVRSEGSGVVVRLDADRQAYVLTNAHVVAGAQRLGVNFQSGQTVYVKPDQVFADDMTDLAVIRFDASHLPHLVVAAFGDSDAIEVGDWVVAIGSPFGLRQTVTVGIVSAKGQAHHGFGTLNDVDLIQTDAAINPGNSGGPLLDLKGRIIGINTAILTRSGGNQGIGFAIPAKVAQDVMAQLISPPHRVTRGYLGVMMADLTQSDARRLGLQGGVVITQVQQSQPASLAGIKEGDIIIRYGGQEVTSLDQLRRLVTKTPPGTTVPVEALRLDSGRNASLVTTEVTVRQRPPSSGPLKGP
jgi:S1-C subfamily serine protease